MEYIPDYGDIVWINFTPQSGHEQAGKRPAVILSKRIYNQKTGLCVCVPMTTKIKGYPFEILYTLKNTKSVILSDQIKSVDYKTRDISFIQKADDKILQQIKINISFLLNLI